MSIQLLRTTSSYPDFQALVQLLDHDLALKNGETNEFFSQYNQIDTIKEVVLVYEGETAVGCGAIKEFDDTSMEVKRMFVRPEHRGKGHAARVLNELETWAKELGYQKCVLETGDKMVEAIGLYQKSKYVRIPNYGQYKDVASSVCFEKRL
jgi:GNAT superfamily N-acetyltransferase